MLTGPVFNPAGDLLGILTNHFIIDQNGIKMAYIRNSSVYSNDSLYLGRIVKLRGRLVLVKY